MCPVDAAFQLEVHQIEKWRYIISQSKHIQSHSDELLLHQRDLETEEIDEYCNFPCTVMLRFTVQHEAWR